VNPFRVDSDLGPALSRWVAGAILCGIAAGVPILPAIAIGTGTNITAWTAPVTWAVGAVPALLLALLLALRPRTVDQVAGYAIVELLLMGFSYGIVLSIFAGD
jgi:hypothetical protein